MKTVEEVGTGLPSFQAEWPRETEIEREPVFANTNRAGERFDEMTGWRSGEDRWRAFQGYDSPLAG